MTVALHAFFNMGEYCVIPFLLTDPRPSVLSYSTATAQLRLGHDYPQGTDITAVVDAHLLLESLGHEHTRVGEWVNIIGYVKNKRRTTDPGGLAIHVQALMLWPTGPLDLQSYETTFDHGQI